EGIRGAVIGWARPAGSPQDHSDSTLVYEVVQSRAEPAPPRNGASSSEGVLVCNDEAEADAFMLQWAEAGAGTTRVVRLRGGLAEAGVQEAWKHALRNAGGALCLTIVAATADELEPLFHLLHAIASHPARCPVQLVVADRVERDAGPTMTGGLGPMLRTL